MPAKNYAATRYSELDEINGGNVGKLAVAFTFSTGVNKGQEAAPLVVDNTMFLVTPFPNIVYALDLTKPGAPLKWSFQPHPEPASQGVACCDVVNRGVAYWDGKIVFNTLDGNTIALDANTGKVVWKTKLARHQPGRDHHDGAAGGEGKGPGRQFRRRNGRPRLGCGARRAATARSSGRRMRRGPTRTC